MRNFLEQILIFLAWAVVTALAFVVMFVGRSTMITVLALAYVGDSVRRGWRVRFFGQAYYVVAGLAFLIFIFVIDGYLKDGRARHDVLRRFFRATGIELLTLFVAYLIVALLEGGTTLPFGMVLLPATGLVGTGFVVYSILAHTKKTTTSHVLRG
jgi:hypothetical protein